MQQQFFRVLSQQPATSLRWKGAAMLRGGCAILVLIFASSATLAQEDNADESSTQGYLIRIPLPISGNIDERVMRATDRVINGLSEGQDRPIIVYEFWPAEGESGQGSRQFERSLSLARYLSSENINRVKTVAYLPRTIQGHALLPVMACEQIIMHPDAEIGDAGIDEESIDPSVRSAYADIAEKGGTIPVAMALSMLDKDLVLYKIELFGGGERYVLKEELADFENEIPREEKIVEQGNFGRFTGKEMRIDHGLVNFLAEDRTEVARLLKVPDGSLELALLDRSWNAVRVDCTGPMTDRLASETERLIGNAIRNDDANLIIIYLDSGGGSLSSSVRLANYLAGQDSSKVRTVVYIDGEARADAALIAAACDHIILHEEAMLGGMRAFHFDAVDNAAAREAIRGIARQKSRTWSPWAAMIDPDLEVFRHTLADVGAVAYFCEEEREEQRDPPSWVRGQEETTPGEPLLIDGKRAKEIALAFELVGSFKELEQIYHLEEEPRTLKGNWAFELIAALAKPEIASTLLFIGFFAMMAEFSSPGIGIGGFLSAVCFILFFWSQHLNGTAGWLEITLFLTGVAFLALEIFVLPGFGIFGIGGIAMVLAALVLAAQTFVLPNNQYQFEQLSRSLFFVASAFAGVTVGAVVLRRMMQYSPLFRRMTLAPPEDEEKIERERRESLVDWYHLLGKEGVAKTPLVPAGKALVDGEWVDVLTAGEMISPGTTIQVIDVKGNQVIVARADNS